MTLNDGPKVYLVASTKIRAQGMHDYLQDAGGLKWWDQHYDGAHDAETLAEFGGRLCYRSWEPGLNPNVTKIRTDSTEYLRNILRQLHGSVLEHSTFSFVFSQVSRVFTHELITHRAGTAKSQESMRYVRLDDIPFWFPDSAGDPEIRQLGEDLLASMSWFQRRMAEKFRLDDPSVPFSEKKKLTSFMRRFAPDGVSTAVLWTANIRALRHCIEVRTAPGAEEEMRRVYGRVAEIMMEEAPALFGDFTCKDGAWVPEWSKV